MSVYAGKYCHFPENSCMEAMIRFGSEAAAGRRFLKKVVIS